jgi:hypothetical protein
MCDLAFGLVRKLQGIETKVSGPDLACVIWYLALWENSKELRQKSQNQMSRKTTVLKLPQMASCPSDVNKMVMLTVCLSCFSVPILKET